MDTNKLLYALFITALGMVIVFALLMLLRYIIELMRVIFEHKNKKEKDHAVIEVLAHTPMPLESEQKKADMDDNELVVVLTAAVMACLGGRNDIVVRSITRVGDSTPVWAKTGRHEQMLGRL